MDFESRIEKLNEMIKESSSIVFFGGAGVSTESGIPDFRSKDGLYNQHDVKFDMFTPEYLLSNGIELEGIGKETYEFYINNVSVTGNNVSFEKNDKGFTFTVKSDYSVLKFEDIKLVDGKTVLYVKPDSKDTVDSVKEAYINKGFTCNIINPE